MPRRKPPTQYEAVKALTSEEKRGQKLWELEMHRLKAAGTLPPELEEAYAELIGGKKQSEEPRVDTTDLQATYEALVVQIQETEGQDLTSEQLILIAKARQAAIKARSAENLRRLLSGLPLLDTDTRVGESAVGENPKPPTA